MAEAIKTCQWLLACACMSALLALALGAALFGFRRRISSAARLIRRHPVQACVLAPLALALFVYGGGKPDPVTPQVKGITLGEPMETPGRVDLAWEPDEGTEIRSNQLVRVYWRDADNPKWNLAAEGYGITNASVVGFFVNRDTDWMVVVSPTNAVEFTDAEVRELLDGGDE